MKQKYRIGRLLLSVVIVLAMILPAYAQIGVSIDINDGKTIINGDSNYSNKAVSIRIDQQGKKKLMDTNITNQDGKFQFQFPMDTKKEYDGMINIEGEKKKFKLAKNNSNNTGGIIPTKKKSIKVNLRIEGNKETILGKTKVSLSESDLDLSTYGITGKDKDYKVVHPTVKMLEQQGINYDLGKNWNFNFITMIDGLKMNSIHRSRDGWKYFVNHKYADAGLREYPIRDGDSIVWFFTEDYKKNWYTWFDKEEVRGKTGEEIKLKLKGNHYDDKGHKTIIGVIKDATLLVNNNSFKIDGEVVKTDKDGDATLKFNEAGTYFISAERFDGKYRDISRPYSKVVVEGNTVSSGNADDTISNQEYKEQYDKVNDPKASEKDIIKATKEAGNKLDKKANALKSEKDAQNVVSDALDVTKIIDKAADRVITEEGAKEVGKESIKVVNILTKSIEKLSKDSDKKEVSKVVVENMKVTIKIMDKIKDTKEINKVAGDMIDAAGKLIKNIGNKNGKEVIESTLKVAEKAVEKASVKEIDETYIKAEKEKTIATVDVDVIKEMAKNTVITVKVIKEKLKKNGIVTKKVIENKVIINVPKTNKKEVEIRLPKDMMKVLKENNIEKATIKTENAVFNLTPNTFTEKEKAKEIGLSARAVDRNTLTPFEKNKVPKGCVVVDLNVKVNQEKVSTFNEDITVSVPYNGVVKKGEFVEVFLLNYNGTIENMGGEYDEATKMVTFKTPHFSKYFAKKVDKKEIKITFKDLKGYEWAKEAIEAMANKGIINGRGKGIFDPAANITRAEFATLVIKMIGDSKEDINVPFTDVAKDDWYYNYVGEAYKNGLISGKSKIVFDPNGNITRQEMTAIIAKVLEQKGFSNTELKELDIFKDKTNIALWAKESVSLCVKEGVVSGIGDGTFAPIQNANRAQGAMMLYNVYQLIQ